MLRTTNLVSYSRHQKISGGHTGGATPDPISNSEVKSSRAHGTAGETLGESRPPPGLISSREGAHASSLVSFCSCGTFVPRRKARKVAAKLLGDQVLDTVGASGQAI